MSAPIIEKKLSTEHGKPVRDLLNEMYNKNKMTMQEIANAFGCTRGTVSKMLKRNNVKVKSHNEIMYERWKKASYTERKRMVKAAHEKNKKLAECGELSFQRVWREDRERMLKQVRQNAINMCKNRKTNNMKGKTGEKHHLWNPNKTHAERVKFRKTEEHYAWVRAVYEKDNYICQSCGYEKGGTLNAHHLFSYHDYAELRHDVDNGVTLCKACHVVFHNQYGYGSNTKSQFDEFCKRGEVKK